MMLDEPIIEFPVAYREFDGAVEHTELTDIDRAVGSFFQTVIDSLVVIDGKRKGNEEFTRFAAKDKNEKIYGGDFESPNDFLTKLTQKTKQNRHNMLPVCYQSRDPVVSFNDLSEYVDITAMGTLTNDAGEAYASVNKSYVRLTYTITVLAWNKATLSRIAIGIMMWMRHRKNGRQHVFKAATKLAGAPIDINIEVVGVRDAMADPAEVSHEDTRLYASTITYEVISELYEAESMISSVGRASIEGGQLIE